MATKKIYAIRDNKVSSYKTPFVLDNEIEAVRGLQHVVNDAQSQIFEYPEDFDLYRLGEFDDVTGVIQREEPPKFVISAVSLVRKKVVKDLEETKVIDIQNLKPAVEKVGKK